MTERSLRYRPYLDGLRGIAVLLVFIFHSARPGLPGGFIGVDIFFVLSGYLITRILLSQYQKTGRIRIANFYARRIRRLMPAVVFLVVVVVMREALWGDVLELAGRLKDSIATLFYFENWNLISQADQYFAESASASPLRHAWSLSIEEQFYLLWPVLLLPVLIWGRKRPWRSIGIVAALVAASTVVMAVLFEPQLIARAYYGTDARVQQPLMGAVLAMVTHRLANRERSTTQNRYLWPTIAISALLVLFAAARVFTGDSPGYYRGGSLLVAVAAALLIYALEQAPEGWMARSLGWQPIKQLGRISYGFYLWHWPVILWLAVPAGFTFWERRVVNLGQFALTLAISIASFIILENPIRDGTIALGRLKAPATIAFGLTTIIAAAALSYTILAPDQSDLATAAIADRSYEPCPNDPQPCVKVEGASSTSPTVVLVGDSTAQSYDPALKELARKYGFRYVQAAVGGCPISHRLLATGENGELHKPSNFTCFDEMPGIHDKVVNEYKPSLIIATSWNETNQHTDGDVLLEKGTPEHIAAVESSLREALTYLTSGGARLALIDVLPPSYSVDCLDKGSPTSEACTRPVTDASGEGPYNQIFHELASEMPSVYSISMTDVICPNTSCPLTFDGIVLRYDGGHLTASASRHLAPILDGKLANVGIDMSALSSASST